MYQRLCLSFESSPSNEQIEDNCRQLLIWWQKKLPLKNQPSNPVTQMLRAGLDEAPQYLAEARSKLLDPIARKRIDDDLRVQVRDRAMAEFFKFLSFATSNGTLSEIDEGNLYQVGESAGLTEDEMRPALDAELEKRGLRREEPPALPEPKTEAEVARDPRDPNDEFRRLLRLSGLSDDDMTDDQRDALCNMGENLGLTGGQAEDLIDEFLEAVSATPLAPVKPARPVVPTAAATIRPATPVLSPKREEGFAQMPAISTSPLARARERQQHPDYRNSLGSDMKYVASGILEMGSAAADALANEQPVTKASMTGFYISRFPVTNKEFEEFDPTHKTRRAPWADDSHPVVYVSSEDAIQFTRWLSGRERKEYRLPTEAEWEYAARSSEGRHFPWGDRLDGGGRANFADKNTTFAWADARFDTGFAQTSPVGSFPKGASPCGAEDMAGNVWEWCLDFFDVYKGADRVNPRGPTHGQKRVCRGGSWKSRAQNLRSSARGFNLPNFSSNDVGFRIVCEVKD